MIALADHLWQSTWFAVAACLLASFVRNDSARVRYWIWLAASLKFLIPFAALNWIGTHFILLLHERPTLLPFVQHATAPLMGGTISIERAGSAIQYAAIAVWLFGSGVVLARWLGEWLRAHALVGMSVACDIVAPVAVRCSDRLTQPAVFGVLNPVIVLPTNALTTLTPTQIGAVIAHELWHVRRRDNLAAALQTLIQALFWFHPMVWWIGKKLLQEREHACDEGAISDGHDPTAYAETLLQMCRRSVASRGACAASVGGGDLSARVRTILSPPAASRLALVRRAVLAGTLFGCTALPVALGMKIVATGELQVPVGARSIQMSSSAVPTFVVVQHDYVYASNVSIRELISQVYAVDTRAVRSYEYRLDYPRYDIELRAVEGGVGEPRQLVAELLKRQFNLEVIVRPSL